MIGSDQLENASQEGLLEMHSIDVGQGDATLIIGPDGETTLVDVGVGADAKETISENMERRFQARDDVDGLDNIVVTHFDQDHADRAAEMANDYDVDSVYAPSPDAYDPSDRLSNTSQVETESLSRLDVSDRHDTSVYTVDSSGAQPSTGVADDGTEQGFDLFSHEDADASVLNPAPKESPGGVDRNSGSLAFSVDYGSSRAVLTSDASELARDEEIADKEVDFSSGYEHGSRSSIEALRQVDPRHVNFSCDESKHGHPHDEMADEIAERGSTATTTQEHGTTSWIADGEADEVFTQHGEPVDGSECSGDDVSDGLSGRSDPEPGYAPEIPAEESPEPQYRHDQDMPGPDAAGELPSEAADLSDDSIEETFEGLSASNTEELSEFFSDLSEAELEENADIDVDEAFEGLSESDLEDGFTVDADEGISSLGNRSSLTDIDGIGSEKASDLRDAGIDERSEVTAEEVKAQVDGIGDYYAQKLENELPLEDDPSKSETTDADDDREQSAQRKSGEGEGEDGYEGEGIGTDESALESGLTEASSSGTDSETEPQEPATGAQPDGDVTRTDRETVDAGTDSSPPETDSPGTGMTSETERGLSEEGDSRESDDGESSFRSEDDGSGESPTSAAADEGGPDRGSAGATTTTEHSDELGTPGTSEEAAETAEPEEATGTAGGQTDSTTATSDPAAADRTGPEPSGDGTAEQATDEVGGTEANRGSEQVDDDNPVSTDVRPTPESEHDPSGPPGDSEYRRDQVTTGPNGNLDQQQGAGDRSGADADTDDSPSDRTEGEGEIDARQSTRIESDTGAGPEDDAPSETARDSELDDESDPGTEPAETESRTEPDIDAGTEAESEPQPERATEHGQSRTPQQTGEESSNESQENETETQSESDTEQTATDSQAPSTVDPQSGESDREQEDTSAQDEGIDTEAEVDGTDEDSERECLSPDGRGGVEQVSPGGDGLDPTDDRGDSETASVGSDEALSVDDLENAPDQINEQFQGEGLTPDQGAGSDSKGGDSANEQGPRM